MWQPNYPMEKPFTSSNFYAGRHKKITTKAWNLYTCDSSIHDPRNTYAIVQIILEIYKRHRSQYLCTRKEIYKVSVPWYSNTLSVATLRSNGLFEFFEAGWLFQLFNKTFNSLFTPFVFSLCFFPTQQPLNDRRVKAGQHRSHDLRYKNRARPALGCLDVRRHK